MHIKAYKEVSVKRCNSRYVFVIRIWKLDSVAGAKELRQGAGITPAVLFLMVNEKSRHHTFYFPFVF